MRSVILITLLGCLSSIMATLSPIGPSDIAELATITLAGEAIVWPGSAASYMRRSRRNTGYLTNSERMQQGLPLNKPDLTKRLIVPAPQASPMSGSYVFTGQCYTLSFSCTDSPCSSTSPPTGGKTATTATTQDTQGFIDTCAAFCSAKTSFLAGWWNGGRSFACLCGYSGQQATCSNGDYSYARFERV